MCYIEKEWKNGTDKGLYQSHSLRVEMMIKVKKVETKSCDEQLLTYIYIKK
jgi:hypothetical protein